MKGARGSTPGGGSGEEGAAIRFREIAHGSEAYGEALVLRHAILRAPLGLVYTAAELAAESGCRHVAGFRDGRLVAYGQLRDSGEAGWLRMKQVAVRADLQGTGIGRALVADLEARARVAGALGIVLHARETAAEFYGRLGYSRDGGPFLEVGLPHARMRKAMGAAEST